jgi:O-antigen ligase
MTLAPVWRNRLQAAVAAVVAVWLGVAIGQQELLWPGLCAGGLLLIVLVRTQSLPVGTVLLGLVSIGYIVGNRGFAQLSLAPPLPLLPAEFVLLVAGGLLTVQCAFQRDVPWRRDALNLAVLAWIGLSTWRLLFDLRPYGILAVRDFAMVYYAGFFFLAQAAARAEADRRFLIRCLVVGCVALLLMQVPYALFQDFFLGQLVVRGAPLIYYKGDLVGTFLAAGAVILFARYEQTRRWWWLAWSVASFAGVIATNNRSSTVGIFAATVLLLLARRWKFAAFQFGLVVLAVVGVLCVSQVRGKSWRTTPLGDVYERVMSLTDPLGERTYVGEATANKGDNNLFRAVWWRAVFLETVDHAPWFGLGFGYDLADRFTREYYPEGSADFTARSPHNVVLTVFARTGIAGLLPFLAFMGLLAQRMIRIARREPVAGGLWGGGVVIFVSACFGVVLEGPMGAVVFWTLLGVANASYHAAQESAEADEAAAAAAAEPESVGAASPANRL